MAKDPVCDMLIDPKTAAGMSEYNCAEAEKCI
jgi:YHS domain-containing protein